MTKAFSLDSTYIHLRPDESAHAMQGGAQFWAGIEGRHDLDQGRLMGRTGQSADWDHWERHPAGDEILTLLSGELELVLDTGHGEERALMSPARPSSCPRASGTAAS